MSTAQVVAFRDVSAVVEMPYHAFDQHPGAHMLRADPAWLDPFIGIDSYTMPQPFFGPHPHAGMSAVTLMLPEADGGFINRDSLGDRSIIHPGDLHWTQAGKGMMHEEVPSEPGKAARGMQVFVNLARVHKQSEPAAFHVEHQAIPLVQGPGSRVRVVAGEFSGQVSPIVHDKRWLTRVNMLDVTLEPTSVLRIPVARGDQAFFVIRSGVLVAAGESVAAPAAVFFNTPGAAVQLQAGAERLRGVFFSGTPLREPVFPKGPFMGNSAHDVAQYAARFQRGEMGHLTPSFARA